MIKKKIQKKKKEKKQKEEELVVAVVPKAERHKPLRFQFSREDSWAYTLFSLAPLLFSRSILYNFNSLLICFRGTLSYIKILYCR